jgi:uncharacterized protein (DUF488 family)
MSSREFQAALDRLEVRGGENAACVMCAETQWRRCHRRLIADALLIRGWRVLHLGVRATPTPHELTSFAVVGDDKTLTYPPLQAELQLAADSSRPPAHRHGRRGGELQRARAADPAGEGL